jgi:hypothetical protein
MGMAIGTDAAMLVADQGHYEFFEYDVVYCSEFNAARKQTSATSCNNAHNSTMATETCATMS